MLHMAYTLKYLVSGRQKNVSMTVWSTAHKETQRETQRETSNVVILLIPKLSLVNNHEASATSQRHYRDVTLNCFAWFNFSVGQLCQYNQSLRTCIIPRLDNVKEKWKLGDFFARFISHYHSIHIKHFTSEWSLSIPRNVHFSSRLQCNVYVIIFFNAIFLILFFVKFLVSQNLISGKVFGLCLKKLVRHWSSTRWIELLIWFNYLQRCDILCPW